MLKLNAVRLPVASGAVLLALLLGACAEEPQQEFPVGAAAEDVPGDESPWTIDTLTAALDTVAAPTTLPSPAALPQVQPPRTVTAARPVQVRDTTRSVQAVFGRAEIAFGANTYAPADYMHVVLEDGRRRFESLSDASGSFFFENVPVGRYHVVVSTATKDRRVVWRVPAEVSGTGKLELPVLHIPIDSIRPRRG